MRWLRNAALLGVLMAGVVALGCAAEEIDEENAVEMAAPTVQLRPILNAVQNDSRIVAAIRGPGIIGYLAPRSGREGSEIVTTFRVKNVSDGALAGFKVNEFWYDGEGDVLTGGQYRMKRPLRQDEVVQITLRTPRNARATRSNYEFSHQNGVVEATEFDEMEDPTAIVDDGVLTEVEAEEQEETQ